METKDFLSHQQAVSLIKAVGPKRTVLLMGENGIGKTSVHATLCQDPDFDGPHQDQAHRLHAVV